MDGDQQRGAAGRKLRYFMAKQVLRETDDRLPRVRLLRKREPATDEVRLSRKAGCAAFLPQGSLSTYVRTSYILQCVG